MEFHDSYATNTLRYSITYTVETTSSKTKKKRERRSLVEAAFLLMEKDMVESTFIGELGFHFLSCLRFRFLRIRSYGKEMNMEEDYGVWFS